MAIDFNLNFDPGNLNDVADGVYFIVSEDLSPLFYFGRQIKHANVTLEMIEFGDPYDPDWPTAVEETEEVLIFRQEVLAQIPLVSESRAFTYYRQG